LRKLEEFARNGGIVIATGRRPEIAPGFKATDAEQKEVSRISQTLFTGAGRFVEDEKQLGRVLTGQLRPDVAFSEAASALGFVHRRTTDAEIYFLANTSNRRQRFQATFRANGMNAEWWDPFSGGVAPVTVASTTNDGITIDLNLEPYGSRLIVFSKRDLPKKSVKAMAAGVPMDLSTGWRVSFGNNARTVTMDQLRSWTDADDTRYFSGTATYEKEVNVPSNFLQTGQTARLDFGEGTPIAEQSIRAGMQTWLDAPVREAAVVYINDQRAGSIWSPPYQLDVTSLLRPGDNKIRIVVANLALNYMAGRRQPDYRLLNLRYGERFQPQDMDKVQPIPSGLLGPIRLLSGPIH
jgi:glycosyl hydrolase family 106( putative alpha-L-rhamnosidase)